MRFLRLLPPILAVVFLASFWWDHEGLLRILAVSGWIGYGTNWLAVTMLFRPQEPRPLLGQGLIPAQKERIAEKLAEAVDRNLINPDAIRDQLRRSGVLSEYLRQASGQAGSWMREPAVRDQIHGFIVGQVRRMVENPGFREEVSQQALEKLEEALSDTRLERMAFQAYRRVRGRQVRHILDQAVLGLPDLVAAQLDQLPLWADALPEHIEPHVQTLEDRIIDAVHQVLARMDLKALMTRNLRNYDEGRLERLIQESTIEQLQYIQYLGGALGALGGFVIWKPVWAIPVMAGIVVVVWAADELIARAAAARARDSAPRT